jgi:hypothetical protein
MNDFTQSVAAAMRPIGGLDPDQKPVDPAEIAVTILSQTKTKRKHAG